MQSTNFSNGCRVLSLPNFLITQFLITQFLVTWGEEKTNGSQLTAADRHAGISFWTALGLLGADDPHLRSVHECEFKLFRKQRVPLVLAWTKLVCRLGWTRPTTCSVWKSRPERRNPCRSRLLQRRRFGIPRISRSPRQPAIVYQHNTFLDHDGRIPGQHGIGRRATICNWLHANRG